MELNYEELHERLSRHDCRARLVNYIFRTQGAELKRLDYNLAADALNVSRKTVSRYCDELADLKIIIFSGDKLKLNQDIIKVS